MLNPTSTYLHYFFLGADVEVDMENKIFQGLFLQTPEMKKMMNSYPEFLAIDGTYKLLELNIPVFVFLVEDSNCQSEIVAVTLLANEEKERVEWMLNVFQKKNPSWTRTRSIMTDKDLTERALLKVKFPDAHHLLCVFHTLRTFNREVNTEKLGITLSQRNSCLEILQQMVYARSEDAFNDQLKKLEAIAPRRVLDYYYENWHAIKEDWHLGSYYHTCNFLNATNNRLESMNSKLKSVICKNSTLGEFFDKLFKLISTLENEKNHVSVQTMSKKVATFHSPNSAEYLYFELLTRAPAEYVEKQLKEHTKLKPTMVSSDKYLFSSKHQGEVSATATSCSCLFRKSMLLPCKHLLHVRSISNINLFDEALCDKRWFRREALNHRCFSSNTEEGQVQISFSQSKRVKSVAEKRRVANRVVATLVDAVSMCRTDIFEKRIKVIENLTLLWLNGKNVDLVELVETVQNNELGQCDATDQDCEEMDIDHPDNIDHSHNIDNPDDIDPLSTGNVVDKAIKNAEVVENVVDGCAELKNVKMPPILKRKGRPKGHDVTVVGLSKKRKTGRRTFVSLPNKEKEKIMLKWLIEDNILKDVLTKIRLIEESDLSAKPEDLPNQCIDNNVDLNLIKEYFSEDAFEMLCQTVAIKRANCVWYCSLCNKLLEQNPSIGCDGCLCWYHNICVGLQKPPKYRYWFCKVCTQH